MPIRIEKRGHYSAGVYNARTDTRVATVHYRFGSHLQRVAARNAFLRIMASRAMRARMKAARAKPLVIKTFIDAAVEATKRPRRKAS